MEKKIVTMVGTKLNENGPTKLHTLVCDCGGKYIRAAKQSSLNFYTQNPKYLSGCCKSQFKYIGEVEWIGDEIVGENTPAVEPVIEKVEVVPVVVPEEKVETPVAVQEEVAASVAVVQPVVEIPEAVSVGTSTPGLVDINTLVKPGRKGVTNAQMITAIKDNKDNEANLKVLFTAYPVVFESSAKYVKDSLKAACEKIIKEAKPEATILMGSKMRKTLEEK